MSVTRWAAPVGAPSTNISTRPSTLNTGAISHHHTKPQPPNLSPRHPSTTAVLPPLTTPAHPTTRPLWQPTATNPTPTQPPLPRHPNAPRPQPQTSSMPQL